VASFALAGPFPVLGIVGLVLYSDAWLYAGMACGLGAVVVGRVAHRLITRSEGRLWGDGFTSGSLVLTLLLGCAGLWVVPGTLLVCNAGGRTVTAGHLREIGAAMDKYASDHGNRLPPAALRDRQGRQLLSWRVLLLPYLGQKELYEEFRLDEPWDSANNLALLERMPDVYKPALHDETEPFTTRLQVLVGPGTAFELPQGANLRDDFPDGLSNTILVIEARQPVPWTKPADLAYSADGPLPLFGIDPEAYRGRIMRPDSLPASYGFGCLLADGSVRYLHEGVSETTFRRAITRNDGLPLGKDW
jgi:hypothetical protein